MFDSKDFNLSYNWKNDGRVMYIDHLWLETLVRAAHYEGAEIVEISIGGGERFIILLGK